MKHAGEEVAVCIGLTTGVYDGDLLEGRTNGWAGGGTAPLCSSCTLLLKEGNSVERGCLGVSWAPNALMRCAGGAGTVGSEGEKGGGGVT